MPGTLLLPSAQSLPPWGLCQALFPFLLGVQLRTSLVPWLRPRGAPSGSQEVPRVPPWPCWVGEPGKRGEEGSARGLSTAREGPLEKW